MLASVFIEQNASREEHINQKEKKKQKTNTFDHLHHEKLRNVRCVAAKCYMQFFHMKYALWTFIHSQPKNPRIQFSWCFIFCYRLVRCCWMPTCWYSATDDCRHCCVLPHRISISKSSMNVIIVWQEKGKIRMPRTLVCTIARMRNCECHIAITLLAEQFCSKNRWRSSLSHHFAIAVDNLMIYPTHHHAEAVENG